MNHHLYPTPEGTGAYPGAKPSIKDAIPGKEEEAQAFLPGLTKLWEQSRIAYMVEPEWKIGDIAYEISTGERLGKVHQTACDYISGNATSSASGFYMEKSDISRYPPGHTIPSSECVFVERLGLTKEEETEYNALLENQSDFKRPMLQEEFDRLELLGTKLFKGQDPHKEHKEWQPVEEPREKTKDGFGTTIEYIEFEEKCLNKEIMKIETKYLK